jgi:hypothetical protein
MKRIYITIIALLALAVSSAAQTHGSMITGKVTDSAGHPQLGVMVEILTASTKNPIRIFTDIKGAYTAKDLLPGTYVVKASASSFLPTLRESINLKAGAVAVVNLTLNTLMEAVQLLPTHKSQTTDDQDWRWTLRSTANRPILRVLEEQGPLVVVQSGEKGTDRVLKASVTFIAGQDGNQVGGPQMSTAFNLEQPMFSSSTMSLGGNIGMVDGQANGVFRAAYKKQSPFGTTPEIAITARRFASPDAITRNAAMNALALTLTDGFNISDFVALNYGGELQSVQFRGRATAFRPFGSIAVKPRRNTMIEYKFTSAPPVISPFAEFSTTPVALGDTNPRISILNFSPQLERAQHQELGITQKIGKNSFQASAFHDSFKRTSLLGVGDPGQDNGNFLTDMYSNTFAVNGGNYTSTGFRAVAQRRITNNFSATINYSIGNALSVSKPNSAFDASQNLFVAGQQQSISGKLNGEIMATHTKWSAGYKWTTGKNVVSSVDLFNATAGATDPFLSFSLRQPVPGTSWLPGKLEALIDVRNLLAQGYVPMLGSDGKTVYLVQSARSIRGGLNFKF